MKNLFNRRGVAKILPLLAIVSAIGLVSFLLLISTAPFKNAFDRLFPKPTSMAAFDPNNIPNFSANPTITSSKSGNWSSAGTWNLGRVPNASDVVSINPNHTVIFDPSQGQAKIIGIQNTGKLEFIKTSNTTLSVGTLLVRPGGTLEVGTLASPIPAGIKAEIVITELALNSTADPEQFGTGLISLGKVTMQGEVKSPTFVQFAQAPKKGDTTLNLKQPVTNWRSGDRLVLPDTRKIGYQLLTINVTEATYALDYGPTGPQWETATITSVSGSQITISAPLKFDHLAGDPVDPDFMPHVGNVSRNVVVRSANPAGTRGHVLMADRADIDIRYVRFADLGRTTIAKIGPGNLIGRYPLHMHHLFGPATTTNPYQFTLVGNAVDGGDADQNFKGGIVIHNSHYGLIKDNVVYNAPGSAIVTESGSESNNVFEHNFALRSKGSGESIHAHGDLPEGDLWFEGAAFWFNGPNNYVRGNVGADGSRGNIYYHDRWTFDTSFGPVKIPKFKGANPDVDGVDMDVRAVPLLEFKDNIAYGAAIEGVDMYGIEKGIQGNSALGSGVRSILQNTVIWNSSRIGMKSQYGRYITIDGMKIRNGEWGIVGDGSGADFWVVKNADVSNTQLGYISGQHYERVEGGVFTNNNIHILFSGNGGNHGAPPRDDRSLVVTGTKFQGSGVPIQQEYNLSLDHPYIVYDYERVRLEGYNGKNYRLFYLQQDPNFVIPATTSSGKMITGCPDPTLTNQQCADKYFGWAFAGEVAHCLEKRPEFPNSYVCEMAPAPTITPSGGNFTSPQTVTMSSALGGEIRYTLDNTLPSKKSTLYTGPFTLATSAKVRARVFKDRYAFSDSTDAKIQISDGVGQLVAISAVNPAPGLNNYSAGFVSQDGLDLDLDRPRSFGMGSNFGPVGVGSAYSFWGLVKVPTDGSYQFGTESLSQSWLSIDGVQLVSSGGRILYETVKRSGTIKLKSGYHFIRVEYSHLWWGLAPVLNVFWQGPGFAEQKIPNSVLFKLNSSAIPAPTPTSTPIPVSSPTPIANISPIGNTETIDCTQIKGWTCDQNNFSQALTVNIYKDNSAAGGGVLVGNTLANVQRPDLITANVCGGTGNHGISASIPAGLKDGQPHQVYLQPINIPAGTNPVLGGSPQTIQCAAATPVPTPTAIPTPAPSPACPKRLLGDINCDGKIDIFDYNILVGNFNKTSTGIQGDLNGDNKVDIFDYNILVTNYGK